MGLSSQIFTGTVFLTLSAIIHVVLIARGIEALPRVMNRLDRLRDFWRLPISVGLVFTMVVFSHTIQVWMWATAFLMRDAFPDWSTSVYFSLVTYTTVGYGDVILGPDHRIFAAFAAVTGLLTFGLSTAFLVGLVTRILKSTPLFEAPENGLSKDRAAK